MNLFFLILTHSAKFFCIEKQKNKKAFFELITRHNEIKHNFYYIKCNVLTKIVETDILDNIRNKLENFISREDKEFEIAMWLLDNYKYEGIEDLLNAKKDELEKVKKEFSGSIIKPETNGMFNCFIELVKKSNLEYDFDELFVGYVKGYCGFGNQEFEKKRLILEKMQSIITQQIERIDYLKTYIEEKKMNKKVPNKKKVTFSH